MFKGTPVSPGIVIAEAYVIRKLKPVIRQDNVKDIEQQLNRLDAAVVKTREQIRKIYYTALNKLGEDKAAIFQAHLSFLDDPEFVGQAAEKIKTEQIYAEYSVKQTVDNLTAIFNQIDDEYFKERALDLQDVGNRLIYNLLEMKLNDISCIDREVILIASDVTPSETAQVDVNFVKGFVTDTGGKTSHTAIMAKALGIPAVVGAGSFSLNVNDGDLIILDGADGSLHINPGKELREAYIAKKRQYDDMKEALKQLKSQNAVTLDGHRVEMAANIGSIRELDAALDNGAEAIGLFRTEFLYMDRNELPGEEEQFEVYREIACRMRGKPVIIRTLDIGGDKRLSYFGLPKEENPFLGWRAIRICLQRKEIFKCQLRAILRASAFGNIRIMFPMISSLEELREAKAVLDEAKSELREKEISFNDCIQAGIMVEVPAVAVMADVFAREVDFFSIGTNDLCQYTLAVDRMNEKISNLYEPAHPAILRLIDNTIRASHREGKMTGMCGEMASDPALALILLGLGLDEFSMSASSIPAIKRIIRSVSMEQARNIAREALGLKTAQEVKKFAAGKLQELDNLNQTSQGN